jgi:hypothetical protein
LPRTGSSAIYSNTAATGGGVYADYPDDLAGVECGANVYGNTPDNCRLE